MMKQPGCVSDVYYLRCYFYLSIFIDVVPSPKVIEPPHNLSTTVGSTAVFTCDFEAATDNRISQIHWVFNGNDLAGCKRFQDRINCTVTQNSTDTNYISSTLEIHSVQADNAGQYTCYCSYDTNALNVDGVQVIQSDPKSATLSVKSGTKHSTALYSFLFLFLNRFLSCDEVIHYYRHTCWCFSNYYYCRIIYRVSSYSCALYKKTGL